ncbi:MAG: anti-sigma factor family protein [Acidobacteriota bacterium]
MSCIDQHQLLDLYFHEGEEGRLSELSAHAARCPQCRAYLASVKRTMGLLSELGEEEPAERVIGSILAEISVAPAAPAIRKTGADVVPILQIAFGEILIFALIYFIKIQISFTWCWEALEKYGIVRSIGSFGVSVILVLLAGSFITLALAPILLMESNRTVNS